MTFQFRMVWILAFFLALTPETAFTETAPTIAVDHANPPFMFMDETTRSARGLYPVIIRELFQEMKATVTVEAMPWNRALNLGREGRVGIGGIYKTEERQLFFDYSDPIFEERLVIYVLTTKQFPFHQLKDLTGKVIGVIRGWSYGDEFDAARQSKTITTVASRSDTINFQRMLTGDIDCLIAIQEAGDRIVRTHNYQSRITMLPEPLSVNPTYIVFSKSSNNKHLLKTLNTALQSLKSDGRYEAILNEVLSHPGQ